MIGSEPHRIPSRSVAAHLRHFGGSVLTLPERAANLGFIRAARSRVGELSTRRWLLLVLGLGFAIRLVLAPFTAQTDLETFSESSVTMAYGGSPYTYLVIYPPGWVFVLNLLGRGVQLFVPASGILVVNPNLLRLFMLYGTIFPTALNVPVYSVLEKLLLWGFDLLLSGLLYQIVRESGGSVRAARLAFALWFVNPLVVTVSGVHGAYDVIPSFFGVAGIYLLVHRFPLSSGAAVAAGVTLKIFPLFLIPVVAVLLYRQAHGRLSQFARGLAAWGAGAGGVLLVALWPPGIFRAAYLAVSTGPSVGQSFGGFWFYSLTSLPDAGGPRSWLYHNSQEVAYIALVVAGVSILLVAALLFRRARVVNTVSSPVTYAAFLSFAMVYTIQPITQPQYLLWTLPWLILIAIQDRRLLPAIVWISSLTLFFYYLGLEGPYYLLEPFAQFTPWLTFERVVTSVAAWQTEVSLIRMVVTIAVFLVLLYATIRGFRELVRRPEATG